MHQGARSGQAFEYPETAARAQLSVQGALARLIESGLGLNVKRAQRFEHKTTSKAVPQKIDTPVRFPASLNMAPYTTLAMSHSSKDGDGSTCVFRASSCGY